MPPSGFRSVILKDKRRHSMGEHEMGRGIMAMEKPSPPAPEVSLYNIEKKRRRLFL